MPATTRIAVPLSEYANSDLNGDAPAYLYSREAEAMGFDPWRTIDGADAPDAPSGAYEVWFSDGDCASAAGDTTVYLSARNAARLLG